ncbi:Gp15 family bacteriophage protein [Treponema pectinovorum]|uniref:Gp15 family bacteriophage protein n=1 Tax=Treponema pectinovorum TaxID=164 RepID=UPI0011C862EB|nr:Gp15 family bacteriophage protein [Treponema pectinovorum]
MTLTKTFLPSAVKIDGIFYEIHTEHSHWLTFSKMLNDKNANFGDFDFLYKDEKPLDRKKGFFALYDFYLDKTELPRQDKNESENEEIAYDYEIDAGMIYSAFLEQYGIDLFEKQIHWHKFKSLFLGLHDTRLNRIVEYRLYKKPSKNDTYEKQMEKQKRLWQIETEEDKRQKEALKRFSSLLKKN